MHAHERNPMLLLQAWQRDARAHGEHAVDVAVLSTATPSGETSARVITIKDVDEHGIVFTTHLATRKARELAANAHCSLTLWWPVVGRQVRMSGDATPIDRATCSRWFDTRPRAHQVATVVSPQGTPIESLEPVSSAADALDSSCEGASIPAPPHFGGFRVEPHVVEFWTQADDRLHERWEHVRENDGWTRRLLAP